MTHALTVYLAGPISGLRQADAIEWRRLAREELEKAGQYRCIDPMRGHDSRRAEEALRADGHNWPYGPKAVFLRDRHDVARSQILLVNLLGATKVSLFTMMEMAWAYDQRSFVLTVMEPEGNVHEHLAVTEASSLVVSTMADAIKYLRQVHNQ